MANQGQFPPMGPPMSGQMQPMGGPQMGGPPMGGPPMGGPPRPPARQGTSRMVPVVVSAGLAVGVFCGLLFGLGTGKSNAAPVGPVSNGVKHVEEPTIAPESVKSSAGVTKPPATAGSAAGSAAVAATGSAGSAAPAAGSDAGSAAEPRVAKLLLDVKPEMAGTTAKVTVDDKEIAGLETDVPIDANTTTKKVRVKVRALGYRDYDTVVLMELGHDSTANLELVKGKSSLPATPVAGNTGDVAPPVTPPATAKANTGTTGDGSTGTKANTGNTGNNGNTGTKANTGTKSNTGTKTKPKGNGGLIDI